MLRNDFAALLSLVSLSLVASPCFTHVTSARRFSGAMNFLAALASCLLSFVAAVHVDQAAR